MLSRSCIAASKAVLAAVFGVLLCGLVGSASLAGLRDPAVFVVPGRSSTVSVNLIIPYEATRPALAHYVEHLVYLSVIRGKFDGTDPDDNATTNKSAITYTLNGPISQLPAILHVLAGVFAPLDLSTRAADEERDIVMREYDLDHDSGMEEEATDALNTFLFEGNGMSVSVLGSRGDIAALTLADAQRFHRDTHRPERAMLLVSGGVSTDDVAGLLATTGFPQFGSRGAMKPVCNALACHVSGPLSPSR